MKKRMYMDAWLGHFAVQQKLTEDCKSTITNLFLKKEKKSMDLENRLVVAKREGEDVEWTGSLQLVDVNYCIWSG